MLKKNRFNKNVQVMLKKNVQIHPRINNGPKSNDLKKKNFNTKAKPDTANAPR